MYHLPIAPEGLTMRYIGEHRDYFPRLYVRTYSLPFILDLLFYGWLLRNDALLAAALSRVLNQAEA
jgi:hypothetical protein